MRQHPQFTNGLDFDLADSFFGNLKLVGDFVGLEAVAVHAEPKRHNSLLTIIQLSENSLKLLNNCFFHSLILGVVFAFIPEFYSRSHRNAVSNNHLGPDSQAERILEINSLKQLTKAVVEAARESLVIGQI